MNAYLVRNPSGSYVYVDMYDPVDAVLNQDLGFELKMVRVPIGDFEDPSAEPAVYEVIDLDGLLDMPDERI